jgi:hypothetical protein
MRCSAARVSDFDYKILCAVQRAMEALLADESIPVTNPARQQVMLSELKLRALLLRHRGRR